MPRFIVAHLDYDPPSHCYSGSDAAEVLDVMIPESDSDRLSWWEVEACDAGAARLMPRPAYVYRCAARQLGATRARPAYCPDAG